MVHSWYQRFGSYISKLKSPRGRSNSVACPCCGSTSRHFVQTIYDIDHRLLDIVECDRCSAYLNYTDLEKDINNSNVTQEQAAGSDSFYLSQPLDIEKNIEAWAGNLTNLVALSNCGRGAMLDFGAGMGYATSAGTRFFETVFAIEPSRNMLAALLPKLPGRERIVLVDSVKDIRQPLDAVYAWHVLEHLPFLLRDFRELSNRVVRGGAIFFQVPLFQPSHLVNCHYTFLNDKACRVLCASSGMSVKHIIFDNDHNFMTCIAIKS